MGIRRSKLVAGAVAVVASSLFMPAAGRPQELPQRTPSTLAEETSVVGSGSRVRLSVAAEKADHGKSQTQVGTVKALDDEVLVLKKDDGSALRIPMGTIRSVEVRESSRKDGAARGLLIGVLAGAALGAAAGSNCHPGEWMCFSHSATAFGGAVLGAPVGALVGLAFPQKVWHEVHLTNGRAQAAAGVTTTAVP